MRLVILGGTGFIGRHLCQALGHLGLPATVLSYRPDHEFLAQHAPGIRAFELETEEARDTLAAAETIIHLGHLSRPASNVRAEGMEIGQNVEPAVRLFSDLAARRPGVRVLYASTGGQIYGPGHASPIPETAPARPTTPYALGKHLIEQSLLYFAGKGQLRATILRLGNPVGRWQLGGRHGFVSAAVQGTLRGEPLVLFGDGDNMRDYFDADELGAFLARLSCDPETPDGVFNVGSGVGLTERQVLAEVEATLGTAPVIEAHPARGFDLPYAVLDAGRARAELGWAPRQGLPEMIGKLAAAVGT